MAFNTGHFSIYILSTIDLLADGESGGEDNDNNVETGVAIVLIPAAVAAVGVIALRKRK